MEEQTIIKSLIHYKQWMENMAGVYRTAGDNNGCATCTAEADNASVALEKVYEIMAKVTK